MQILTQMPTHASTLQELIEARAVSLALQGVQRSHSVFELVHLAASEALPLARAHRTLSASATGAAVCPQADQAVALLADAWLAAIDT